jgi:hypothetical protein
MKNRCARLNANIAQRWMSGLDHRSAECDRQGNT